MWIYTYNNDETHRSLVTNTQGRQVNVYGLCVGAALIFAKAALQGLPPEGTMPIEWQAKHVSAVYGTGVLAATPANPTPQFHLGPALTLLNLRYTGHPIFGSGIMVLNTLLTRAPAGVYILKFKLHMVALHKESADRFYLFDANEGLFEGTRMEIHGQIHGNSFYRPFLPLVAEAREMAAL